MKKPGAKPQRSRRINLKRWRIVIALATLRAVPYSRLNSPDETDLRHPSPSASGVAVRRRCSPAGAVLSDAEFVGRRYLLPHHRTVQRCGRKFLRDDGAEQRAAESGLGIRRGISGHSAGWIQDHPRVWLCAHADQRPCAGNRRLFLRHDRQRREQLCGDALQGRRGWHVCELARFRDDDRKQPRGGTGRWHGWEFLRNHTAGWNGGNGRLFQGDARGPVHAAAKLQHGDRPHATGPLAARQRRQFLRHRECRRHEWHRHRFQSHTRRGDLSALPFSGERGGQSAEWPDARQRWQFLWPYGRGGFSRYSPGRTDDCLHVCVCVGLCADGRPGSRQRWLFVRHDHPRRDKWLRRCVPAEYGRGLRAGAGFRHDHLLGKLRRRDPKRAGCAGGRDQWPVWPERRSRFQFEHDRHAAGCAHQFQNDDRQDPFRPAQRRQWGQSFQHDHLQRRLWDGVSGDARGRGDTAAGVHLCGHGGAGEWRGHAGQRRAPLRPQRGLIR